MSNANPILPPSVIAGAAGWTDERTARLRSLWDSGHSASQIARDLGRVSRNAVIGKVHRMGLRRSTAAALSASAYVHRQARQEQRPRREPAPRPIPAPVRPLPASSPPRLAAGPVVDILALRTCQCRYPIGDPQEAGFGFCGEVTAGIGSYCARHRAICSSPVDPRKRDLGRALRRFI